MDRDFSAAMVNVAAETGAVPRHSDEPKTGRTDRERAGTNAAIFLC